MVGFRKVVVATGRLVLGFVVFLRVVKLSFFISVGVF